MGGYLMVIFLSTLDLRFQWLVTWITTYSNANKQALLDQLCSWIIFMHLPCHIKNIIYWLYLLIGNRNNKCLGDLSWCYLLSSWHFLYFISSSSSPLLHLRVHVLLRYPSCYLLLGITSAQGYWNLSWLIFVCEWGPHKLCHMFYFENQLRASL